MIDQTIQWYNAHELRPTTDKKIILIDGWTSLTILDEYKFNNHEGSIELGVNFFCLLRTDQDDDFNLDNAMFYKIDEYHCCDVSLSDHYRHLISIGCYLTQIHKFVKKEDLNSHWSLVNRWAYLKS